MERFSGGSQRFQRQLAGFGRKARLDNQRAVLVVAKAQIAAVVQCIGTLTLSNPLNTALLSHQPFHVTGGAVTRNLQQIALVVRSRHAGHGTHLGVAHLAESEGLGDPRQMLEAVGDPQLLPGCHQAETTLPVEPVGAGENTPLRPSPAAVELRYQAQQAISRGVDVGSEFCDLIFRESKEGEKESASQLVEACMADVPVGWAVLKALYWIIKQ